MGLDAQTAIYQPAVTPTHGCIETLRAAELRAAVCNYTYAGCDVRCAFCSAL